MAAANLGSRARHPPLLYIALATTDWAPRSGTVKGSDSAFGPSREINPNKVVINLHDMKQILGIAER